MTLLEAFDLGVKKTLVPDYRFHLCYVINGNDYKAYEDNASWDCFVNYMMNNHPTAYNDYGAGSGGELKPKNGKPPKMASFASSSRLIYTLAKHKSDFVFEKKLPFTISGVHTTPNLDGFMEKDDEYVFVEAKCREIYSSHEVVSASEKYYDLYDFLSDHEGKFSYEKKDGEKVTFKIDGNALKHFDLKQMICHLLGIANAVLDKEYSDKPISFKYLLYNPCNAEFDDNHKEKIMRVYKETLAEANSIDFKVLFDLIIQYLVTNGQGSSAKFAKHVSGFTFEMCDQFTFPAKLD